MTTLLYLTFGLTYDLNLKIDYANIKLKLCCQRNETKVQTFIVTWY
jgi:hypothetical protein